MRFFRPWYVARTLFPGAYFRIKTREKVLFLTFDDGPDPESTPQLLEILERNNVKALFFCNGRAAEKFPELVNQIRSKGHLIGNHGYSHLNGWKTSNERYCSDVFKASEVTSDRLFRPPYGRLRPGQYRKLRKSFKIVFWDLLPYDFDRSFGPINTLEIIKNKIRPGSIIALHDNCNGTLVEILDKIISFSKSKEYRFETISFV